MADQDNKQVEILFQDTTTKIWGMSPQTRTRKMLSKQSVSDGLILILRGDVIYDAAVLSALCENQILLQDDKGTPLGACVEAALVESARFWILGQGDAPQGLDVKTPAAIGASYRDMLRKKEDPYALIVTNENKGQLEWDLYKSSYKGVTDLVTKYWWPVPAFHVTRFCAALKISPNMVTSLGAILTLAALWLFWEGHYGWGLLAGWIMTFLDTVDGKLARVTLTSSPWGNVFDHGIDLIHPPFWYIAWGIGLSAFHAELPAGWLSPVLIAMFAFYVLGRLCEGYFIARFESHIHVWRKGDSRFRLISSRRNPNMIILTVCWALAVPDIGLLLITAWGGVTLLVHLVQIAQAEMQRRKGQRVKSWLTDQKA